MSVVLQKLNKVYPGGERAVTDFELRMRDGEFVCLFGPTACGKSTVLRMIAGLEMPTSGDIEIDGKFITDLDAKERDVALVLQNANLNAQSTVYDNLASGLKRRKVPKEVIDEKVKTVAEILALTEFLPKFPKALNGLQRCRLALGRVIAREPALYLFDEPFSNLDEKLKRSMLEDLGRLHLRLGSAFLYATSSLSEAMSLATRVAVMNEGFLQQIDTPKNLYDYPANLFVARLVCPIYSEFACTLCKENGQAVIRFAGGELPLSTDLEFRLKDGDAYFDTEKPATLLLRAEDMSLQKDGEGICARVSKCERLGSAEIATCELTGGETLLVRCANPPKEGSEVRISVDMNHALLFDGETERTLLGRDAGYETLEDCEKDAAFVPLTPQERAEKLKPKKTNKKK